MKDNEWKFIGEIALQLTEIKFDEEAYEEKRFPNEKEYLAFSDEAEVFYNERYDEIESLYINLIKNK